MSVAFGAPFFFRVGEGEAAGEFSDAAAGVSADGGVSAGVGLGVSVGSRELLVFFFRDFGLWSGLGLEVLSDFELNADDFFEWGRGDGVGVASASSDVSRGEGDGDSLLLIAFFFFRAGVGVGVDRIFLIVLPIDSSPRTGSISAVATITATIARNNLTQSLT